MKCFFSFLLMLTAAGVFSQPARDTLHPADSARLTQDVIIQQQQQIVDSLVKQQLQQQLETAVADSREYSELKQKLAQLDKTDSVRKASQAQRIAVLKKTAKGYPVAPFRDTLFYVYASVGSVNAGERADLVSEKIKNLYKDNFFSPDSLRIITSDNELDINYNNTSLFAVTDIDALWENTTREAMAQAYLAKIRTAIREEKIENSLLNWVKRIALVFLTIGVLVLVIYFINRLFRYLTKWLRVRRQKYLKGWQVKNVQVLRPEQQFRFVLNGLNILRFLVILLALYLSLPVLFSVFPETKNYTETLLNWIIVPIKNIFNGITAFLPNLFTILVVWYFTKLLIRAVHYFAMQVENGTLEINGFHREFATPTYNIIRFLLYAFMLVIIWPYLPGHESAAFQGVSVFLGVLLSLGSSSAISNLIAGLIITYMRPFKIGDRVKIGDVVGDVLEKTMLVTRIRTPKNEDVTIPNSSVLSNYTINYSSNANDQGLIVHVTVTLGYDTPYKKIYEALIAAALRTEMIEPEPRPFVLQTSLDDFSVAYQLNAYTRQPNRQAKIYSDLMQNMQDCCNEAGIEIMSPTYNVVRRNEDSTIPEEYRKSGGQQ